LHLGFNLSGDRALEVMPVVSILRQLLHEIAREGASKLKEITMDLKAYCDVDDIEPAYSAIVVAAQVSLKMSSSPTPSSSSSRR
jgi:hypothetical protein